jgi:acyl CoA:acetate/3-ketoacid CoA transferase beta subunit
VGEDTRGGFELNAPTKEEVMVTTGARALKDGDLVVVGVGLPQVAAILARKTRAPNLNIVLEIGVINPNPVDTPVGIADPRIWHQAEFMGSTLDVLGMILQRGMIDVGFLGGVQVDQFGNLNTTLVYDESGRPRRLVGSGGANDLASLAKETIIIMRHEKRKFLPRVQYVTSPGFITGSHERSRLGLPGRGPRIVITDLCVFGFDQESERMKLVSLHPGVTADEVTANTGFEVDFPKDLKTTPIPSSEELRLLRGTIDPQHVYIGKA